MRKHKHPCGCVADDRRWLVLCPDHARAHGDLHEQAAREHRGIPQNSAVPLVPIYNWLKRQAS